MHRYHARQALRAANLSTFEEQSLLTAVALLVAGVGAAIVTGAAGGIAAVLGIAGLVAFALAVASSALRRYRAGRIFATADMRVRRRPLFHAITLGLALGLPFTAAAAAVAALEGGWLFVAGVLLVGGTAAAVAWLTHGFPGEVPYTPADALAEQLLKRLCMRADMRPPKLVVVPGREATAWTTQNRIHVTEALLRAPRRRRARSGAGARARPPRPPRRRGDGGLLGPQPRPPALRRDRAPAAGAHGPQRLARLPGDAVPRRRRRAPCRAQRAAGLRDRLDLPAVGARPVASPRGTPPTPPRSPLPAARAPSPPPC